MVGQSKSAAATHGAKFIAHSTMRNAAAESFALRAFGARRKIRGIIRGKLNEWSMAAQREGELPIPLSNLIRSRRGI